MPLWGQQQNLLKIKGREDKLSLKKKLKEKNI